MYMYMLLHDHRNLVAPECPTYTDFKIAFKIACGHRPFSVRFIRTADRNTTCSVSAADPNSIRASPTPPRHVHEVAARFRSRMPDNDVAGLRNGNREWKKDCGEAEM